MARLSSETSIFGLQNRLCSFFLDNPPLVVLYYPARLWETPGVAKAPSCKHTNLFYRSICEEKSRTFRRL